jgi:ATP synthase protein I
MAPKDRRHGFEDFDARMARVREERAAKEKPRQEGGLSRHAGFQAGIEIIGGVVGGGLIGFLLDHWLGTRPWMMIVFFILGAAGGLRNAYRRLSRLSEDSGGGDASSGKGSS